MLGRRRWLLLTLPLMSLFLMAAAIAYSSHEYPEIVRSRDIAGTVFIYCEFLMRSLKPMILRAN
jgi:hypothetical protein